MKVMEALRSSAGLPVKVLSGVSLHGYSNASERAQQRCTTSVLHLPDAQVDPGPYRLSSKEVSRVHCTPDGLIR